jgi:glucose/arabinose dehydrogenase
MTTKLGRLLKVVALAIGLGLVAQVAVRWLAFRAELPADARVGVSLDRVEDDVSVVAEDLEAPWEIEFLDDGFLVTERPGRLTRLAADGARRWSVDVPGVQARGEGGLMGLARHPRFADNRWIFLYLTTASDNRIVRYQLGEDGSLTEETVLLDAIPASAFHNGGRLAFGPDAFLYATTGDAGHRAGAQDPGSLGGKILRMTDDGSVPPDSLGRRGLVFSLGHRNPQGLAWDEQGRLWSTEHGRSGATSGLDELNLVQAGGNYGWPDSEGDVVGAGTIAPLLHSGPDATWAPSGAAWLGGRVLFGGLRGEGLYDVRVDVAEPELTVHFFGDLGRIRAVRLGPDGLLYLLTGNRDGRGRARRGDDRILRVDPDALVVTDR